MVQAECTRLDNSARNYSVDWMHVFAGEESACLPACQDRLARESEDHVVFAGEDSAGFHIYWFYNPTEGKD